MGQILHRKTFCLSDRQNPHTGTYREFILWKVNHVASIYSLLTWWTRNPNIGHQNLCVYSWSTPIIRDQTWPKRTPGQSSKTIDGQSPIIHLFSYIRLLGVNFNDMPMIFQHTSANCNHKLIWKFTIFTSNPSQFTVILTRHAIQVHGPTKIWLYS